MSNYFADSFNSGFQSGQQSRERRKNREQEDKLEKARQALAIEQQARQLAAQKELQLADQTFRGGEGEKDRSFRTSERLGGQDFQGAQGELERRFRTSERVGGQEFQGTQGELERAARQLALDKELQQRATLAGAEQAFKDKQLGWQKDPTNPTNAYYGALAKSMSVPDFDMGGGGMSPEDQQALEWARANPNDPRSAAILKRLSGK